MSLTVAVSQCGLQCRMTDRHGAVTQILSHVNKRVKANTAGIQLPVLQLARLLGESKPKAVENHFRLMYVQMGHGGLSDEVRTCVRTVLLCARDAQLRHTRRYPRVYPGDARDTPTREHIYRL